MNNIIALILILLTLLDISLAVTLTHLYTKKVRQLIQANLISVQEILKKQKEEKKEKELNVLDVSLQINQESTEQSNGNSLPSETRMKSKKSKRNNEESVI